MWKEHFPIWTSRSHRFSTTAGLEIVKLSIREVKIYVFAQMVYYMSSISEQVKVGRYMRGSGKCHQSSQETRIQLLRPPPLLECSDDGMYKGDKRCNQKISSTCPIFLTAAGLPEWQVSSGKPTKAVQFLVWRGGGGGCCYWCWQMAVLDIYFNVTPKTAHHR